MNILRRGFSLIEMIVVIAVAAILIGAITVLVGRLFSVSREQVEQTRTTEDARIQLEHITDILRNARSLDCNNNGQIDQPNEWWLQSAEANKIVFYSNVDADSAAERITYEHNGSQLLMTIDQNTNQVCNFTPGQPNVIAHSIRNESATPAFTYITANDTLAVLPVTPTEIRRIRLELLIKTDDFPVGNPTRIVTEVTPRTGVLIAAANPQNPPAPQPEPPADPPPGPGPGPAPGPPQPPVTATRDGCQRTGTTVNNKIVMQGDGGCVYVNSPASNVVWRSPEQPPGGGSWPNAFDFNWPFATSVCANLSDGGRNDWRLPTTDEVAALSWQNNKLPSFISFLPPILGGGANRGLAIADMYFWLAADLDYPIWTSTEVIYDSNLAEIANIRSGQHSPQSKIFSGQAPAGVSRVLCVAPRRATSTLSRYPTSCSSAVSSGGSRIECDEDKPQLFGTSR